MFKVKRRLSSRRRSKSSKRDATTRSADLSSVSDTPPSVLKHTGMDHTTSLRGILRLPQDPPSVVDDGESHSKSASAASLSWTATSGQSGSFETGKSSPTNNHNNNNSNNTDPPKRVLFGTVHVREYERALGDNPSCSSGAPLTIGWGYDKELSHPLDEFETTRLDKRRSQPELILTRQTREELLLEWGASFHEIIDAIRTNVRVKNQRRRTVNAIGTYDRWEEVMENAGRKIKKTLMLQKTTGMSTSSSSSNTNTNSHFLPKPARRISLESSQGSKAAEKDDEVSSLEERRPSTSIKVTSGLKKSVSADAISSHSQSSGQLFHQNGMANESRASFASKGEEKASTSSQASFLDIDCDVSSMASGSDFGDQYNEDFGDLVSEEADDASTIKTMTSIMELQQQQQQQQASRGNNPIIVNTSRLFQVTEEHLSYQYDPALGRVEDYLVDDDESDTALENLRRDNSFWEVDERSTGPGIRRKITPVIISEDNNYSDLLNGQENHWASGFRMHPPPPYSSNIVSQWE